jgi:hypothetical protein
MLNPDAIGIDGENAALERPVEAATAVGASGELIGRCRRPRDIGV